MNAKTKPVFVVGADEFATAVCIKLSHHHVDHILFVPETEFPLRHNVSFGSALSIGEKTVGGISAVAPSEDLIASIEAESIAEIHSLAARKIINNRQVPVLEASLLPFLLELMAPDCIVLATGDTESEVVTNLSIDSAPFVVGLIPHHRPGEKCHAAVESQLNSKLGQIVPAGTEPSSQNFDPQLFRNPFQYCSTPLEGAWVAIKEIGEDVSLNEALGTINSIEIRSPYVGTVWGIVNSGRIVAAKQRVAQVHTGTSGGDFREPGFQALAVAGGLVESVFYNYHRSTGAD